MKKLLALLLVLPLTLPFWVSAQIFNQSQIIVAPYGGPAWLVSTSTNGSRKLDASTSPYFGTFTFGQATGSQATTTSLGLLGTKGCNTSSALTTNSSGAVICGAISGSGTVPGGSDTQVQFNDGGTTFGGNTNLTFQKLTGLLTGLSSLFTFSTTTNFLATGSSTLQTFTFTTATGSAATTTSFFTTTASSTNLFGQLINGFGLSTCTGTNALTWTGGSFTCTAQPQGTVTSVTGTANRITSTGGATPQIDISGSYVGQSSITTVGTLSAGAVPASLVTNGTFGTGDYTFPANLTITSQGTLANLLVTSSSTLQNFTGLNSTTTNATSTSLFTTTASTTKLFLATSACSGSSALNINSSGQVVCGVVTGTSANPAGLATQVQYNDGGVFGAFDGFTIATTTAPITLKIGSTNSGRLQLDNGDTGTGLSLVGSNGPGSFTATFPNNTGTVGELNLAQTWTGLQTFSGTDSILATSSTTLQNFTFVNATGTSATTTNFFATTASSSNLFAAKFAGAGLSSCSGASNALTYISASSLFGCNSISSSGGGNSKWATSTDAGYPSNTGISPNGAIFVGIGTTTPEWALQLATSTRSQLTLTDNVANTHYSFRVSGNTLYLATSSPTTFATSSSPALSIDASQPAQGGIGTSSPWALFSLQTNQSPYATGVLANPFTTLFAIASSTATATTTLFAINNTGQILASSTSPTLSSCGTGPTMGAGASNSHGRITAGATATGCTITFANAYSSVPACIIENETGSITNTFSYTVTASAITVTETALGGDIMDYMCMGNSS